MRIVIADDASFIRQIIQRVVRQKFDAAEIVTCENGAVAYEAIRAAQTDWLITDLLMPVMTGQELIKKLRAEGRLPNTVVISADVQRGTKDELKALGVEHYINKPLNPEKSAALVALIEGEGHAE